MEFPSRHPASRYPEIPDPAASPELPPADGSGRTIWRVSELTSGIKEVLEGVFPSLWLVGEVSDLSRPRSGHLYFTLKDDQSQIRTVVWRSSAARLAFDLEDGQQIICQGSLEVYAPRGTYQFIARKIEPVGIGALQRALQQLQTKLAAEGLFAAERKRPLPPFPQRVGLVTSPSGAAIRDFLEVALRRFEGLQLLIFPTRVQGEGAADEIAAAIDQANRLSPPMDVIVVTRGGGSLEDLWSFNEEPTVRAIARSSVPVVSAVGHEIDVTLTDLAADLRAATPTEAAERIVPSRLELEERLSQRQRRLRQAIEQALQRRRQRISALADRRVLRRPLERVHDAMLRLDELQVRASRAIRRTHNDAVQHLRSLAVQLESLSPLNVLSRGYSVTLNDQGQAVGNADDIHVGQQLTTHLHHGRLISRVESSDSTETDPSLTPDAMDGPRPRSPHSPLPGQNPEAKPNHES